jgi:hypothetical protein
MKRKLLVMLAAVPLMVGGLFSSGAQGAVTETEHLKNFTETFVDQLPCVGGRARITLTYNAVFHFTATKNGEHFTGTITGRLVADPLTPGVPTYRGHFTQWFGNNSNPKTSNGCFTFNVNARASDGSRLQFHENAHFIANKSGVAVVFDKIRCH